jgi:catechol 2,3-dioxygenase-like lactoylglutathione lyase family enzyme
MTQNIAAISLIVPEYDEAITYYTRALGFTLVEDSPRANGGRWVVLAPRGSSGCRVVLARAKNDRERAAIGNQGGGRVFLFLNTDDFDRDHRSMLAQGVRFLEEPRDEPYGKVAVFEDTYGNRWDLLMPRP